MNTSSSLSDRGGDSVDPVCGMNVSQSSAFHVHHDSETYYFCSEHCMHRFEGEPETFVGQPGSKRGLPFADEGETDCSHCSGSSPAGQEYSCPMHPEIRQQTAGGCPKCGMALEPDHAPSGVTRTQYVCPMHPEVVQEHPGSCPKCGMALEPREAVAEDDNPELVDMSRRFRVSALLAIPVFVLAMIGDLTPQWLPA